MNIEQKLHANINTAKEFGLRVYLCYQNNTLVKSYVAKGMDAAYEKLKFNYPIAHIHIELMELTNKETLNSPNVYEIVRELFGEYFKKELDKA